MSKKFEKKLDIYNSGYELGYECGKEDLINKACEWLLHQEEMIGISFENDFIERFKKAMNL